MKKKKEVCAVQSFRNLRLGIAGESSEEESMLCGRSALLGFALGLAATAVCAQEPVDYGTTVKIREEGFRHSQVMDIATWLTDVYGPRFAHSPSYRQSAEWAAKKFTEFGLENVHLEPWGELGPGWENQFTSVHLIAPGYMPLIAYPLPWTKGTDGVVQAEAVYLDPQTIHAQSDVEKYRKDVKGAIVFAAPVRVLTPEFTPPAVRLSDQELQDMASLQILPKPEMISVPRVEYEALKHGKSSTVQPPLSHEELRRSLRDMGAAVLVSPGQAHGTGNMDKGIVFVEAGQPPKNGESPSLPELIMATEHYNRILRILEKRIHVKMQVEVRNAFYEDDPKDYNVIAEIPGSDLKQEVVMVGGHLDAEPAGTGATDNAAGAAAVMEAARILKAVGVHPRRTIRFALWGGEELGRLGSQGYVKKHFGDPKTHHYLPEHDDLAAYFNMDWYGRFRGVYLQGNDLVRPIFEEWMKPFHDLGMTYLVPGNTGGTDHISFQEVGLPGFQFVQDDLEFFTTTWHTNMDLYDRLVPEDLIQASVVLASFSYDAATSAHKLPRPSELENKRRWFK